MEKQRLKMYESFFVGAILAVIGGYLDAYTYKIPIASLRQQATKL